MTDQAAIERGGGPSVLVAIVSIGRQTLAETLVSLQPQALRRGRCEVFVVDDSGDGSARRVVEAIPALEMPVRVVPSGHRNISRARNLCIDAAAAFDVLVFIDDDQTAHASWLDDMEAVQRRHGADVVVGSVKAVFPDGAPGWVAHSGIWDVDPGRDGTVLRMAHVGGSLLSTAILRRHAMRFDEQFGVTGGEDSDFFRRLSAHGGRIVAGPGAVVYETVPAKRCETAFLRTRFRRIGHTNAQIITLKRSVAFSAFYRLRSVFKLVVMRVLYTLARSFWPYRAVRFRLRAWTAEGELSQALGRAAPRIYAGL